MNKNPHVIGLLEKNLFKQGENEALHTKVFLLI